MRIIFGLDEESQGDDVKYYNHREKPPLMGFTPDGYFPVVQGEKGIITLQLTKRIEKKSRIEYIKGGIRSNMVPEECEAQLTVGDGEGDYFKNQIVSVAKELKIRVLIHESMGCLHIKTFGKTAHASRPTEGINAVISMFRLLAPLLEKEAGDDISFIKFIINCIGEETDGESPIITELMEVYHLHGHTGKPIIMGGSTFAKSMENIVAYGPVFLENENTAHEANENMTIDNLIECSKIYGNALYKLSFY